MNRIEMITRRSTLRGFAPLLTAAFLATTCFVDADEIQDGKSTPYRQIDLVSDQPNAALLQDTNLVNPWGTSFSASSPFSDAGKATLYAVTNNAVGSPRVFKQGLEVSIPGNGTPTGQLFNSSTNFNGDSFLFVTKDGIVAGWRSALGTTAEVLAARPTAAYTGVTMWTARNGATLLLLANFAERTIDVYDSGMQLVGQLTNPNAPAGYAPFNIQVISEALYVTFAREDADPNGDVKGRGQGFIDVLDIQSQTFHRLVSGTDVGGDLPFIDAPWGLALAPNTFGPHAGELLVGNFGSGTIMTFDDRGHFDGFLEGVSGKPIVNNGLWTLTFGNGNRAGIPETLYFTAGPDNESHGIFGSIEALSEALNGHDNRAPAVPKAIHVPHPNHLHFHGFAQGVQIYTWNGATWGSATPQATLFNDEGNVVIKHFAGPTWESADGSKTTRSRYSANRYRRSRVDPVAAAWRHEHGRSGRTLQQHQIHPAREHGWRESPSAPGTAIGESARVPYTADYFFYEGTRHSSKE
jgi:uncharacterized protein (TIGR03118 family)